MAPRAKKPAKRVYARRPVAAAVIAASGSTDLSEDELGIGVEDEAPAQADALESLLANPAIAKLIDAAVAQRLAKMGAPQESGAMEALARSLGEMIQLHAVQQPGYQKPLAPEVLRARLDGKVEMEALLKRFQVAGTPPEYIVGEQGFFECTNAAEFSEGQRIRTYLPPVEDFVPYNLEARQVHAAMMTWIGGPTPGIGEQVESAMKAAHEAPLISNVFAPTSARPQSVELIDTPTDRTAPRRQRRQMGSIVAEPREVSLADRAAGPVFVDANAA